MLKTRIFNLKGFILLSFVLLWSVISVNAAGFTVTKTADTNDGVCDADCSLREALASANAAATDDVINFAPAVFNTAQTIVLGGTQLFVNNNGSLTIEGTGANLLAVSGNNASRILLIDQRVAVTINNLTLRNGNGQGSYSGGGAIYSFGNLTLNHVVVTNNTATDGSGGGINNNETLATLTINNSVITNNSSNISGGGIVNFNVLHLNNSTVTNNSASFAGGIYSGGINNSGQFNSTNSTISNNIATTGGGIYLGAGAASFVNSTISGNGAFADGGGIYTINGTTAGLLHSTISHNRADFDQSGGGAGGGIYNLAGGIVNARGALVGDNDAAFGSAFDWRGTVSSDGFNLIENLTGTTISGNSTGNITGQDPQLLQLGNYGGATRTVALAPFSPAIDAAAPNGFPATDQRGVSRPQDGDFNGSALPDIGAYERQLTFLTVTKTEDTNDNVCDSDCSLREAISTVNATPAADYIVLFEPSVFAAPQTITLTNGQLTIANGGTLLISGTGASLLSISGNNQNRVLFVDAGATAALKGVTVTRGKDPVTSGFCGGGGILASGFLALTDSAVTDSRSELGGGAVCALNGSRLIVFGSIFSGNSARVTAGGIYNNAGNVSIADSVVTNNISDRDGGGVVNAAGSLTITNVRITGNVASRNFGGFNNGSGRATVSDSVISGNKANTGGAGGIGNSGTLSISKTHVINNTAAREGAGIATGANLTGSDLTVAGNQSKLYGGGIYNSGFQSVMTITNSTISGNSATGTDMNDGNGGGIYNAGIANLTNSTVTNNSATASSSGESGLGGGIFNMWTFNATNVTISNNSANRGGGGVRNGSTFSTSSIFNARGGIIADNAAQSGAVDFDGILNSQGYNLLENTNGSSVTGTTTGNILGQDPKLGPLANNGGFTQTRLLLLGSPAIDAADPANFPATDQRGVARPKDGDRNGTTLPDIGAFERNPVVDSNAPYDFDGDGKTDIGVWRAPSNSWWYLHSSDLSGHGHSFGLPDDIITPGDYTGDGKADVAIWRPTTGEWFVRRSEDGSYYSYSFGLPGDLPAPADYDGDGKTDTATFRPSTATWYIFNSGSGTYSILTFGLDGDKPVPADYDGDGKADIATWRSSNGTWWIVRSSDLVQQGYGFGLGTDKPVVGDYTGDGKADIAVWRDSTREWFFLRSEDGSYFSYPSGLPGDIPAPGDYDGDGKFDSAVFRPSTQTWYIDGSTAGSMITTFGLDGDRPVANAFVP